MKGEMWNMIEYVIDVMTAEQALVDVMRDRSEYVLWYGAGGVLTEFAKRTGIFDVESINNLRVYRFLADIAENSDKFEKVRDDVYRCDKYLLREEYR